MPCSLAVMGGMACTPSSRSSSLAHAAWPSFCGGTWVRIAPSSETAGRGLWPVPVWSSVSAGTLKKKGCLSSCFMSGLHWKGCERFMPSAPGSATLWRTNPERFGFSQQVKTRMDDITGMKSLWNVSASLCTYLDVVDWVNVLHRVHHDFSYLDRRRRHITGTFHYKTIPWMSLNLFDTEDMKC